ncbi:rRNA maturation RNase YbeY [Phenylobacterium sp.]|uniref:rRNA maturation RNase YbeY n=1 Tax=Phenylobacterium sp. TaxID=1871053 RepID=UPI002DE2560F|nr:rRNA maturation RNase YbeY [Phenylobacterium sp.]
MIDIEIEDAAWTAAQADAESLTRRAAEAVLAYEHLSDRNLTVLLTNDLAVQALNERFRQQDRPTNVLSFPALPNREQHLGDVALAYETCAREAADQGKPLAAHLQHLVAHGVLHLLGYDHMTDPEAHEMEGLERVVLASLGVSDPYAAGEGDHD